MMGQIYRWIDGLRCVCMYAWGNVCAVCVCNHRFLLWWLCGCVYDTYCVRRLRCWIHRLWGHPWYLITCFFCLVPRLCFCLSSVGPCGGEHFKKMWWLSETAEFERLSQCRRCFYEVSERNLLCLALKSLHFELGYWTAHPVYSLNISFVLDAALQLLHDMT